MSQIVAIWGAPGSGKTTLAVKLSRYITKFRKHKVICVLTDPETPSIQVLFTNYATSEMQSIGAALSAVTCAEKDVLRGSVTVEDCPDLLYMGYCRAENINSYPVVYESKARDFYTVLSGMADYVIVDCMSNARENVLSKVAIKMADVVVRLYAADIKSLAYMESQASLYNSLEYKFPAHVKILNCTSRDIFSPIDEIASRMEGCKAIVPFFKILKQQMADGQLYMPVAGSKVDRAFEKLFKLVAADDEWENEKRAKKEKKREEKQKKKEIKDKTV